MHNGTKFNKGILLIVITNAPYVSVVFFFEKLIVNVVPDITKRGVSRTNRVDERVNIVVKPFELFCFLPLIFIFFSFLELRLRRWWW